MSGLTRYKNQASEKFPPFPLEFDDGVVITLKSVMSLEDEELSKFSEALDKQQKTDDSEKGLASFRADLISMLADVSDSADELSTRLTRESLGVLTGVLMDYTKALSDGAKSAGTGRPDTPG